MKKIMKFQKFLVDNKVMVFILIPIIIILILLMFYFMNKIESLNMVIVIFFNVITIFGYILTILVLDTTKSLREDVVKKILEARKTDKIISKLENIIFICNRIIEITYESSYKELNIVTNELLKISYSYNFGEVDKDLSEKLDFFAQYKNAQDKTKDNNNLKLVNDSYQKFALKICGMAMKVKDYQDEEKNMKI